jgi:hypothetical protein
MEISSPIADPAGHRTYHGAERRSTARTRVQLPREHRFLLLILLDGRGLTAAKRFLEEAESPRWPRRLHGTWVKPRCTRRKHSPPGATSAPSSPTYWSSPRDNRQSAQTWLPSAVAVPDPTAALTAARRSKTASHKIATGR